VRAIIRTSMIVASGVTIPAFAGLPDANSWIEQRLDTQPEPQGVVIADFNGDNQSDIATANRISDIQFPGVSVFFGGCGAVFGPEMTYEVGSAPRDIAAADFDGDGDIDLVTANGSSDNISVLLNNGDGTFAAQRRFGVGDQPWALAIADIDGNTHPDIVTANAGSDDITIRYGNGSGNFPTSTTHAAGAFPIDLVIANFANDGVLDIYVINRDSDNFSAYQAGVSGTVTSFGQSPTIGDQPSSIAVGELNNDGAPDVAITLAADNGVLAFKSLQGGFPALSFDILPTGPAPSAVAINDANLDGFGDIIVANSATDPAPIASAEDDISVIFGRFDDTFEDEIRVPVGNGPTALATGDLSGDEKLDDIVVANGSFFGGDTVSVLTGRFGGTLCPCDYDGDGVIAFPDVSAFLDGFVNNSCLADFSGNGVNDFPDVGLFLICFTFGCP